MYTQNPTNRLLSADENGLPSLKAVAYIEETHHSDLTNNNNKNNQSEVLNSLDCTHDNSAWDLGLLILK